MVFFTKNKETDRVIELQSALSAVDKARANLSEREDRSREAIKSLTAITERLEAARNLAVDAAARGEEPPSTSAIEDELREAQRRENAYARAVNIAEDALNQAKHHYEEAAQAELVGRYVSAARELLGLLNAALEKTNEVTAIYSERPRGLPVLFLPHLEPMIDSLRRELDGFVSPRPVAAMPAGHVLVKFVRSHLGGGAMGRVGTFNAGEVASFKDEVAADLVARGFAERVGA